MDLGGQGLQKNLFWVLLGGLIKDWITSAVHASSLPSYGKVLFVMGATIGILGGLFFVLERLRTHDFKG